MPQHSTTRQKTAKRKATSSSEAQAAFARPKTLHKRVTDKDLEFARVMVATFKPEGLVEIMAELAAQARIAREAGLIEVTK